MPVDSCDATFLDLLVILFISIFMPDTVKPNSSTLSNICLISLALNRALVGMHPQFKQIPPKCLSSTNATVIPS